MNIAEAFASFTREAWRLEARDLYRVPEYDEQIAAWLAGQPMPPRRDGWDAVLRDASGRGARISRTRLVGHPLTEYTRWEFELYRENVELGEDIRVVDREGLDDTWASASDVWLFDDQLAFRQDYDDDGTYRGAVEIDPAQALAMRRALAPVAVPVTEYRLADDIPTPRPESTTPAASLPRHARTITS